MRAKLPRAALAALAALMAAAMFGAPSARADERLDIRVEVSLRPIQPNGETRYYKVAGRPEPVYWDPVLPVVKGDVLEVRVLPTSGERPLSFCQVRLNGWPIETFRSPPPYEAAIDTATLAEGWHLVEAFCQQADSHPMRASGSVRFLLVKTLEDPEAAQRIAALEQLRVQLAEQALKRQQEYTAEVARLSAEQADKEKRHQQALAETRTGQEEAARLRQQVSQLGADLTQAKAQARELESRLDKASAAPVSPTPAAGFVFQGALVAGGGTSVGTTPSGETVVLTGALTSGLGTALAPVELTAPPAEPRPTRPSIISALIKVRGGAAGEKVVLRFARDDKLLLEKQYQLFANGTLLLPVQMPAEVKVSIRWADGRVTPANVQPVANKEGGM